MDEIRKLLDQARKEIATKRAEAEKARADMKAQFASAREAGVDVLHDDEAFTKLDEVGKVYDGFRDEIATLEAKRDRLLATIGDAAAAAPAPEPNGQKTVPVSAGARFVESDVYGALLKSGTLRSKDSPLGSTELVEILSRKEFKDLLVGRKTLVTSGATSGGAFVPEDRIPGLFADLPRMAPTVLDLLDISETDLDVVEYVEQTSRTNAAAETAEAGATGDASGAAPESAAAYAVKTANVRDLTHFMPSTKRVLANTPQLSGLLDAELRDGISDRLATQVISGNGTAPNLRGIINTTGILSQALGTDSRSDAIHKGITQVRKELYEPTDLVLQPDDAEQLFLEKDANGNYIYGPPSAPFRSTVWGLRIVVTTHITVGTGLLGAFRRGATLWLREGVSVSASDSHSDFFIRRMVALLAVMQVAFAAHRPKAFAQITGV